MTKVLILIFVLFQLLTFTFLLAILPAFGIGEHKYLEDTFECSIEIFGSQYSFNPATIGIGYFASLIISIITNIYVHIKLKRKTKEADIYLRKVTNIASEEHIKHHEELLEHEKCASKTVKYLSICFAIMFLPCKENVIFIDFHISKKENNFQFVYLDLIPYQKEKTTIIYSLEIISLPMFSFGAVLP